MCTLSLEQLLGLQLRADVAFQQPLHRWVQRAARNLHCRGRLPLGEAEPLQLQAGLLHLVRCHQLQSSKHVENQSAVMTNQQVLIEVWHRQHIAASLRACAHAQHATSEATPTRRQSSNTSPSKLSCGSGCIVAPPLPATGPAGSGAACALQAGDDSGEWAAARPGVW
jgi:hypothetical protein